jgi:hypothetical protein
MKKQLFNTCSIVTILILMMACKSEPDVVITIHADEIINSHYIGNGAQWDPYQEDYGEVRLEVSDEDWQKLYERLDFMRPQFMRVMINTGNYIKDGKLEPDSNLRQLSNILEYCQSRGVTVMFGDWGGGMVTADENKIKKKNLSHAAELVDYLVNEKGYNVIKYYNLINEPNGYWSATDGSYELWAEAVQYLHGEMEKLELTKKVTIAGPDVAIWTAEETWWIDSTAIQMPDIVGLYDIHTYPSKITVNSGEFGQIISEYEQRIPDGTKIVMGEIGFKFVEPEDSLLMQENIRRAEAKPFASSDDSQMFVYDFSYGIDMADALFQTVNMGYSGSVVWMLDDAMYSKEAPHKLKVWGFWNILGEEYFGEEEEKVRPWFYAWSLLSKYMPTGSSVYEVEVSGADGVKAIATEKDKKYMIAVVNVGDKSKTVSLQSASLPDISDIKKFIYSEEDLIKKGEHEIVPNAENLSLEHIKGMRAEIAPQSLVVYTNFDY